MTFRDEENKLTRRIADICWTNQGVAYRVGLRAR